MLPAIFVTTSPSLTLRLLTLALSLVLLSAAAQLVLATSQHRLLNIASALICSATGIYLVDRSRLKKQKLWQLSVSVQGVIRCAAVRQLPGSCQAMCSSPAVVVLSPHSQLHNKVLFLHFKRANDNNMINLVILSDSVSRDEFRRLSISFKWLLRGTT